MSSGTPQNPAAARAMANSLAEGMDRESDPAHAAMSPAQQLAATRYAFFRGEQYAGWKTGWDGRPATDLTTRDQIGYSGQMPEGFVDFGAPDTPVQFRKPDAPYNLPRLIVQRFSDMLFGEAHHPTPRTPGDPETEDWLAGLVEATRLWAQMHTARDLGGSMGTIGIGFFLEHGRPVVQLFDRRYCTPTFANPVTHKLKALEERYAYAQEERNPETGEWENVWYWFRRVIDAQRDRTWAAVPVADGKEPLWDTLECTEVVHALGEVPVIWLHNLAVPHSADGDPDLLENDLETSSTIDRLTSMANQGITANCDPTLVLESDQEFDSVGKGSTAALQVEKGGKANYLEMAGTGSKSAMEQAAILEDRVLRSARCVIEKSHVQVMVGGHATATEKQKDYSAMWSAVGTRREQYGEKGVRALLELAIRVCRHAQMPRLNTAAGRVEVQEVILPPKLVEVTIGDRKTFIELPRKLGKATTVTLQWPPYEKPPLQEVKTATEATAMAKEKGLITQEVAVRYIAPFFGVTDPAALVRELAKQEEEAKARAVEAFAVRDNAQNEQAQQGSAANAQKSAQRDEEGGAREGEQGQQPAKPPAPPFTARA